MPKGSKDQSDGFSMRIGFISKRNIIGYEKQGEMSVIKTHSGGLYCITTNEQLIAIGKEALTEILSKSGMVNPSEAKAIVTVCVHHPDPDLEGKLNIVIRDEMMDIIDRAEAEGKIGRVNN